MARPTRRLYLVVLAAILLLGGGGGWLAANWRGLAAAYHARRAENLDADPATLREALARVEYYDRRRLVAFWEREMAAINRLEAEQHPRPTDAPYVTLETEHLVLQTGEEIRLTAVLHNPTDREMVRPNRGTRAYYCHLATWAANRRSLEKWADSAIPAGRGGTLADPTRRIAPNSIVREEFSVTAYLSQPDSYIILAPPGLYRIKISWSSPKGKAARWRERWLTVRVLPRVGEPEEKWSAAPTLEDSRHDSFLIEYE